MNTRICTMAASLALLAGALSGCAQTSPRFDSGFGTSVRASFASQVADPAAAGNTNPVTGIDGRAAAAAHQRYEASYARPTEQQSVMPGQLK
jgi:type IV pilus biogenesis protein CpaD/CtpE